MDIGNKIRQLRYKASLTQEQLAEKLGVTAQSVSKWENAVSMPDISLLPDIAEVFGTSIDELFDLTADQKLKRIENRMDIEEELEPDVFREYEAYLKEQLAAGKEKQQIVSLLAHLYHHRLESYARKAAECAMEAIRLEPDQKDCQWILQKSMGSAVWDWNAGSHSRMIEFWKETVASGNAVTVRPYYDLLDNLIADHRTQEARECLDKMKKLPGFRPFLEPAYAAAIALAEYDEIKADAVIEQALEEYRKDAGMLFEAAQYYARKCDYDKAVSCYEASWEADPARPRFIDALEGIAMIDEIRGEYGKAAGTHQRILDVLRNEWGFTEETVVRETERQIERLRKKERGE